MVSATVRIIDERVLTPNICLYTMVNSSTCSHHGMMVKLERSPLTPKHAKIIATSST